MHLISPEIEAYASRHSSPEPTVLARLNQETHASHPMPQMLSGHLQGRVLSALSWMIRPRRVLEIGTFTGYSALCLAEGLAEGGRVDTLDINPGLEETIRRAIREAGAEERVFFHLGPALDLLQGLEGPFDLVFLDADKENYAHYYDAVMDRVRPGGFIVADNVLWSGRVLDEEKDSETEALDAYNRKIAADARVEQVLLPVRDGLMIARKIG